MTMITTEACQAQTQTSTSLRGSVFRILMETVETVFRWQRISAARRSLLSLDDWQLHDLGISRCEIDSVTRTGREWRG